MEVGTGPHFPVTVRTACRTIPPRMPAPPPLRTVPASRPVPNWRLGPAAVTGGVGVCGTPRGMSGSLSHQVRATCRRGSRGGAAPRSPATGAVDEPARQHPGSVEHHLVVHVERAGAGVKQATRGHVGDLALVLAQR